MDFASFDLQAIMLLGLWHRGFVSLIMREMVQDMPKSAIMLRGWSYLIGMSILGTALQRFSLKTIQYFSFLFIDTMEVNFTPGANRDQPKTLVREKEKVTTSTSLSMCQGWEIMNTYMFARNFYFR